MNVFIHKFWNGFEMTYNVEINLEKVCWTVKVSGHSWNFSKLNKSRHFMTWFANTWRQEEISLHKQMFLLLRSENTVQCCFKKQDIELSSSRMLSLRLYAEVYTNFKKGLACFDELNPDLAVTCWQQSW